DAAADAGVDAAIAQTPPDARVHITSADARAAPSETGKADALLRDAEAARTNGASPITQLATAQLAYEANPRNPRATYLFGDALLSTGSVTRGCTLLRQLPRYKPAVDKVAAVCTAP